MYFDKGILYGMPWWVLMRLIFYVKHLQQMHQFH